MCEDQIRDRLVEYGKILFKTKHTFVDFTKNKAADRLLNNLEKYPHAFVLASIMDRQAKAERAWLISFLFMEKLKNFFLETLYCQTETDIKSLMKHLEPLHRFPDIIASLFFRAVQRIALKYNFDVSQIRRKRSSSATAVYRFFEFDGIGPKITSMNANILAREFKIEFSDYYSIDISGDVHVRRFFGRLGLTPPDETVDQLIFRARGLHPEFPGLMDFPAWEIGRKWCKAKICECDGCYLKNLCPSAREATANLPAAL